MASLVTKETNLSIRTYIQRIPSLSKQEDAQTLINLIQSITDFPPKIWGDYFIVGFGKYSYQRKGKKDWYEWFHVGCAIKKTKITIYLAYDISQQTQLLHQLGKHKVGKGCLYINKLADINMNVLRQLISIGKDARWHV